jgi:hypothetical protein
METKYHLEILSILISDEPMAEKYDLFLNYMTDILYQRMLEKREDSTDVLNVSIVDLSLLYFYKSWMKYPGLGVPREKYLNIIEKILEYAKMIIETKCEDYKTLPGMSEFLAESDRQYEEIVTNDPELSALRNDPYGL